MITKKELIKVLIFYNLDLEEATKAVETKSTFEKALGKIIDEFIETEQRDIDLEG